MSLRELLSDLIGAEVQEHPVTIGGKTKKLHFRQISDAEGRKIFAPSPEGEAEQDRGRRVVVQLIAASVCDKDGTPVSDEAEVDRLPYGTLASLVQGAYLTNNMVSNTSATDADDEGAETDGAEKKD